MKTRNYARFYVLLNRMPSTDREELKSGLIRQFSDGRTDSLKELTDKEYTAMCDEMQRLIGGDKAREIYREELRRKRSTVLHLMQKMGIDTSDWDRVNNYCLHPRIAGKEFRKLTTDELDVLAIKLRMISRKDMEKDSSNKLLN